MFFKNLLIMSLLILFTVAANLNNTNKVNDPVELKIKNSNISTIKLENNITIKSREKNENISKNVKKKILKDANEELFSFLIGLITDKKKKEISKDGSLILLNNIIKTMAIVFDQLRLKLIEHVQDKEKIFSRAVFGSSLIYQSANKPIENNQNDWCTSLSTSFSQYIQLNAFLAAAFLFIPLTVPIYFFGFFILLILKVSVCSISAKQILSNIVYRIKIS